MKRMIGQWTRAQMVQDLERAERALKEVIGDNLTLGQVLAAAGYPEKEVKRIAVAVSTSLAYDRRYGGKPWKHIIAWDDQTMQVTF